MLAGLAAAACAAAAGAESTPAPQPAPRPRPPPMQPAGNLTAVNVFYPYDQATNGQVYPCTRIPAIVLAGNGTLIAMAECRKAVGDGCEPVDGKTIESTTRDSCMKRSLDGGATWSQLEVAFPGCLQPNPVWDDRTQTVIVQMNCGTPYWAAPIHQSVSTDLGATWSQPAQVDRSFGDAASASVGPGVGLRLSATNKHAPGRLLFIGWSITHRPTLFDSIWFSDDSGKTYTVANSTLPNMLEAQLVELSNGDVLANMRNRHLDPCDCRGVSRSGDGGRTWGPVTYARELIDPVCQGSVLRVGNSIYFANPGSTSSRTTGVVRRSDDDAQTWPKSLAITNATQGYAYSCLTQVPQRRSLGLLYETNCDGCTGPSCCSAFTVLPADF
eukprot:TRINITY_DN438_c0_g2_i1.p1 TRINITY_DN438_c0_g2~~TRINITY_DN438_c0_g2_i1.p1  ORF type:complete len:421 (+),score=110.34 TRINITY_DN438_c0_g2_i1:111-1265(+)